MHLLPQSNPSTLQPVIVTATYEAPPLQGVTATAPMNLLPLPVDDYAGLENALETALGALDGQLGGQLALHALAAYSNMHGITTRMPKPPGPVTPQEAYDGAALQSTDGCDGRGTAIGGNGNPWQAGD
ncbi:MAG: hypothetical protein ACRD2G_04330, partial [Terriglobia bacterium]